MPALYDLGQGRYYTGLSPNYKKRSYNASVYVTQLAMLAKVLTSIHEK